MISALLNKKIQIEKGVHSTNAAGTPIFVWETYHEPYAGVSTPAKQVRFDDGELLVYTTEFTVRYNSKTKYVNNKYRIFYRDEYYKILQIIDLGNKEAIKFITTHFEEDDQ